MKKPNSRLSTISIVVALAMASTVAGTAYAASPLAQDARDVARALREGGASVKRQTRFLMGGQTMERTMKRPLASGTCRAVIALTVPTMRFSGAFPSTLAKGKLSRRGLLVHEVCGDDSFDWKFRLQGARGAIEIVEASYPKGKLGDLESFLRRPLPDRREGPIERPSPVAPTIGLASQAERESYAARDARLDGAGRVIRLTARADPRGLGGQVLRLAGGCHRIVIIADERSGSVDVDADARSKDGREQLAEDRSYAPDARLEFCRSASTAVTVRFSGASPESTLVLIVARWPSDKGLPHALGAQGLAAVSQAWRRRRHPPMPGLPIAEWIGGPGAHTRRILVLPDTCYTAVLAIMEGESSAARLSVRSGGGWHYDDTSNPAQGAAASFCTGPRQRHVSVDADVRGRSPFWFLGLWKW